MRPPPPPTAIILTAAAALLLAWFAVLMWLAQVAADLAWWVLL